MGGVIHTSFIWATFSNKWNLEPFRSKLGTFPTPQAYVSGLGYIIDAVANHEIPTLDENEIFPTVTHRFCIQNYTKTNYAQDLDF